ncbi:MAG: hypothetical protein JWL61_2691 [Gemmatimonadetes bacterium]|nr:hypothetical protein [Gemmatimonadota bacterium]
MPSLNCGRAVRSRRIGVLTLLIGCSGAVVATEPPKEIILTPITSPVTLRSGAFSFSVTSAQASGSSPQISYRVTNVSTTPANLTVQCYVDVRLYSQGSPSVLVFSQFKENRACVPEPTVIALQAGSDTTLRYWIDPELLFRRQKTAGTYRFVGTVPGVFPEIEVNAGEVTLR